MSRVQKVKLLARHNPGLLAELAVRRARARAVPDAGAVETSNIGDIRFEFDLGLDPDVRAMWQGRYEVPIVRLIKRILPRGGTFVDVGANIGYISAQAANRVGPTGHVLDFEPVTRYNERLTRLAQLNPSHDIRIFRVAAGAARATGEIRISDADNIGYNSLTPKWVPEDKLDTIESVEIATLDELLHDIERADLIKIDTEGFELPVLEGARETLRRLRPKLIVEITPSAARNHGRDLDYLARLVDDLGYDVTHVETPRRPLDIRTVTERVDAHLSPR